MQGRSLGPYRLLDELGSGGMGTVYLAEDTGLPAEAPEERRRVALKIVHPHLLATPGFFKRFMREAELGRKVAHENVVRTFDVDALLVDDQQVHFMVMEYVEGKDLRELLGDLGTIPETLLREIALQTAAGLTAIHAADIVHRDLKPENVLITDDHEVRIMDLGVAKLQEASIAITKEGQFAGSVLYAAPEQFRKDAVGPAADLYSLGVLLYELATGQNPFSSDDASAVIQAHLTETPPRAHEKSDDLSLFFSEVVATLLAKQPSDRFASAEELKTVFEEAERSAWWIERAPALQKQEARLPKIRVSRETALHGRSAELEKLAELFDVARQASGNTVFLEGEAGIGKTRLIDAFLRELGEEDLHVLYGSYPPSGGLGGLSEAVLGKFGEARLADALAPYLTVTPSLVPTFAALIKHESPPSGAEALQGDALQAVVVHLMRALAAEKPTVWIVDDLQFAPQESKDLLLAMARAVEDHRVLLVATARPGILLEDFTRLANFRRITLERLGGREIIEVLEDAFKSEDLAERLGVKITKKSDGVPFFIFEMIRGLKEGQFIRQLPDGSYVQTSVIDEIEVPSAVKDLIEGRMRGLSDDDRNVLDVAAVLGMEFDSWLVAAVLEMKRVQVLQRLAAIERGSGLVRAEGARYRFDQNQIQEVLYAALSNELKAEYHTLLAGVYEGDDPVFLAHHQLRGSRPKDALPHLELALDRLRESYRNETLLDLAGLALTIDDLLAGKERVEVLLARASRLNLLGRRAEQRAALDEAIAVADETGDGVLRGRARAALGWLLRATLELKGAQNVLDEALELARTADNRKLTAQATGHLGTVHFSAGRYAAAQEHYERARALYRELGDRVNEAVSICNLGNVCSDLGLYAEGRKHYERSRELSREVGGRRGEALATGNLGLVLHYLGHRAEARKRLEEHRALSRELGDRWGEARAFGNLGIVFEALGRHEEAQEHLERARGLFREVGDRQGETNVITSLGNLSSAVGDTAEALEHLERACALSREIGYRLGETVALGNLGSVCWSLGRRAEAQDHYERYLVFSREVGRRRGEGHALGCLADVAEASGDAETALRLQQEALTLWRELDVKDMVAATLVALSRLEAAPAHLDEALELAHESQSPDVILAATIERARLPAGDVGAAVAAFADHEARVGHEDRMKARFRLWKLTSDPSHLEEAKRLLGYSVDHAPEEDRDTMIDNVPLHRDILAAWKERGGES